jgi:hypothetical protein
MNTSRLILALGAALLLAHAAATSAQETWQTVADFPSPHIGNVNALTKDATGNFYAAVSSSDDERRVHAQVRKSTDHGTTWTVVEDFVSAVGGSTRFHSLGVDTAGHIYAAGFTDDGKGQTRWIVRKGSNGGNSWSTVDDFGGPGGRIAAAQSIAADARGNLYVAGFGDESPSDGSPGLRTHWLVRQSRDGGRNWSTVDDFNCGFSARATAILSTSGGLFVAGSGWNDQSSGEQWLVRKGTVDGAAGVRWQTVDEFQLQENKRAYDSRPHGLMADARGNLYAVGRSNARAQGMPSVHWIVRRAFSTGTDWTLVDKFQLDPGNFAAARGITASDQGGVYVVGQALDRDLSAHWIVRKSATGETGSWSIDDDFRMVAAPSAPTAAIGITHSLDGSLTAQPSQISGGLSILSDSTRVFAGGSSHGGLDHAMVRRLELGRTNDLSVAGGQSLQKP